jgi:hypothetical protein
MGFIRIKSQDDVERIEHTAHQRRVQPLDSVLPRAHNCANVFRICPVNVNRRLVVSIVSLFAVLLLLLYALVAVNRQNKPLSVANVLATMTASSSAGQGIAFVGRLHTIAIDIFSPPPVFVGRAYALEEAGFEVWLSPRTEIPPDLGGQRVIVYGYVRSAAQTGRPTYLPGKLYVEIYSIQKFAEDTDS